MHSHLHLQMTQTRIQSATESRGRGTSEEGQAGHELVAQFIILFSLYKFYFGSNPNREEMYFTIMKWMWSK